MPIKAEEITKILDNAAAKVLNESLYDDPEIDLAEDTVIVSGRQKKEAVAKMINLSIEEKLRKEQSEFLMDEIKRRFAKLKKISKDNFNMLEVALSCHKIVSDYKKLAKLNNWTEIEALFEER